MDFDKLMRQLHELVPPENFKSQPDTAQKELIELEKKYEVNTHDFQHKHVDISHIPVDIREYWLNTLETYLFYEGDTKKINHLASTEYYRPEEYYENATDYTAEDFSKMDDNPTWDASSIFLMII